MGKRYRGFMVTDKGLTCGPHPDRCDCCRSYRYEVFKRLQRRAKRLLMKRETRAIVAEHYESIAMDESECGYNSWREDCYRDYMDDINWDNPCSAMYWSMVASVDMFDPWM